MSAVRRALTVLLVVALAIFVAVQVTRRRDADVRTRTGADSLHAGIRAATLYFASADGRGLIAEARELAEPATLHDRVDLLVRELDLGPRGSGVAAMPAGTSLRAVYLDDRGLMTLDLSRAFQQGFRGGSTAEYLAIASLVRTVSANVPGVERILITCGGAPMSTLGGHIALDRPLDVTEWL
jgi:spore germination protein GerM